MAFVGVNPEECAAAITGVTGAYANLMTALISNVQTNYIDKIGEAWGSPLARVTMVSFARKINMLANDCEKTYTSIVDTMNSAASTLLMQQNYNNWSNVSFDSSKQTLNINSVKRDINGAVQADSGMISNANGALGTVTESITSALNATKTAIETSGFIGAGMQEALSGSIGTIQTKISEVFAEIANDVQTRSNMSAEEQVSLAQSIASDNFSLEDAA